MPPLPAVPNVCKVIISSFRSDANVENIFHIGYSGTAPSAGQLASFMTGDLVPATETLFNAEGSTDLTGDTVEMIDLSSSTGASQSETLTVTGTRTGDFAPSSAAVVASWTIDRRYRGGHPRSYFPFGTAGTYEAASSKFWDSGFITDVSTKLGIWVLAITGVTIGATVFEGLVNVSYVDKNLNPTPPYRRTTPVVDPIVAYQVRQRICTQRRRLGKLAG